jgi:hypothetical protein
MRQWKYWVLLCLVAWPLRAEIPFLWLDAPKNRDNAHDPKSPFFQVSAPPAPVAPTPSPTVTATPVSTPSPTPTMTPFVADPNVFDDFENGLSFGPGWCCPPAGCWGWPCSASIEWSTDYAVSGTHSWKIKGIHNNNPSDTWSAWALLDNSMMTPFRSDFTGALYVKVWMRSTAPITVRFHWYEGSTLGQGEDWAYETAVSGPTWVDYSMPISGFYTACAPGGDGIPNVNDVYSLWVDFASTAPPPCGANASMTFTGTNDLYIDDVRFSPTP